MTNEQFGIYKNHSHETIRKAKYCDFNRENHIKRFNELPLKTQKVYLRAEFRQGAREQSLTERLRHHKGCKSFLKEFGIG